WGWLRPWTRRGGQVTLNQDVSWDLRLRGGVAHLDAGRRAPRAEPIRASHGVSRVDLRLPRPSGVVPVRIGGGASHVRIRRPAGAPARLGIGRGGGGLNLGGEGVGPGG